MRVKKRLSHLAKTYQEQSYVIVKSNSICKSQNKTVININVLKVKTNAPSCTKPVHLELS